MLFPTEADYSALLCLEATIISKFSINISGGKLAILGNPMKRVESPQDYVNRILSETGMSHVRVAERAKAMGRKLSPGYVHNLASGKATNPSIELLQALAVGLGRPEDEVDAVFRGRPLTDEAAYGESLFAAIWREYDSLPAKEQKELRPTIEMLQREIQRRTGR